MSSTKTAGTTESGKDGDRRACFGRLLAEALRARGMKQEHLAGALGTTQSSVSGWINGKYEPAADTVFRIERSLALEPGHLSRPLGYLPVEALSRPLTVEGAIIQSPLLAEDEKAALVAVYNAFVKREATGAPRADRARSQPKRSRPTAARRRTVAGNGR
ncbi:MAG TPA: helix-turn-helix transcriptional regulator [Acidimicrobiales bacterium]|nr:helix-turn-helix transcriptional regulator [Acidimicrobiales bacterium]